MSEFQKRLGTSATLLLVVAAALISIEFGIFAPWFVLVAAAGAVATWEWAGLLGLRGGLRALHVIACAGVTVSILPLDSRISGVVFGMTQGLAATPASDIVFGMVIGLWGLALLRVAGVPFPARAERIFFGALGLVAPPAAVVILTSGAGMILWLLLVVVIVADTAAYGFGRRFGRTALAPEISPSKTRAGFVGALLAVAGVAVLAAWELDFPPATWFSFVGLALLTACFSVVGDLSISRLKRMAGVKDSGRILPGHGGVLDRVDGLLAASVAFAFGDVALSRVLPT